jgi:hypothetical protein
MGKKPAQPGGSGPKPQPEGWHVERVYSTKPGHKLLSSSGCTCSQGRDHSRYESP